MPKVTGSYKKNVYLVQFLITYCVLECLMETASRKYGMVYLQAYLDCNTCKYIFILKNLTTS